MKKIFKREAQEAEIKINTANLIPIGNLLSNLNVNVQKSASPQYLLSSSKDGQKYSICYYNAFKDKRSLSNQVNGLNAVEEIKEDQYPLINLNDEERMN